MNDFVKKIWEFYAQNKRSFAWRDQISPYRILISEVMLQQTQTARVIKKFEQWIEIFSDFQALACASVHQVLSAWQGLGYNRRGLYLHQAAKIIVDQYNGQVPDDVNSLQQLPGIGKNTAGSIMAFAFNKPVIFIETNIRTVFLHEFFKDQKNISDAMLLPLIEQTVDQNNPREWYYALMDYGVFLKKEHKANNKNSAEYCKQSSFQGSRRQVRGSIVRMLSKYKKLSFCDLELLVRQDLVGNEHAVEPILQKLLDEGMVHASDDQYFL